MTSISWKCRMDISAAAAAASWRQSKRKSKELPLPYHWVYLEHAFFQLIMPTLVPHKVINPNHSVHFHTCQGIIHHLPSFYPLCWAACTCTSTALSISSVALLESQQQFTSWDFWWMMQDYSLLNMGLFFLKHQRFFEAATLVGKWFLLSLERSASSFRVASFLEITATLAKQSSKNLPRWIWANTGWHGKEWSTDTTRAYWR